jgi:AraC-like DNA-binding protein
MKRIILNPLFPFEIKPLLPDSVEQFMLHGVFQIIFIKKGNIQLDDRKVSSGCFIYSHSKNSTGISNVYNLSGYQLLYKAKFLDCIGLCQNELSMMEELKIFSQNQKEVGEPVVFQLSRDLSMDINIICTKMHDEYLSKKRAYHAGVKIRFLELLITLYRSIEQLQPGLQRTPLDIIIDHIDTSYSDNLTLEYLSNLGGYHPSYLSRIFKEKKGLSVFEYINIKRINRSAKLLADTTMTVLEVAVAVGYNNLSYFNRTFRKIMNSTPGKYRHDHQS